MKDEMIQGGEAWLAWRGKGIGSSDLPIIMGESDFSTPLALWRQKTGREAKQESNWAMTRGTEQEAKIRALYELQTGTDCPAELFEHPDLPWARASLDGFNAERKLIVEFKCLGKDNHALAKNGQVPECYRGQLQWQLFVTGAKVAHYVSLDPVSFSEIEIVAITPDMTYWSRMIQAATEFWGYIESDMPPPLSSRDYQDLDDQHNKALFGSWRESKLMVMQWEDSVSSLNETLKSARGKLKTETEKLAELRAQIEKAMPHPRVRCAGVKVMRKNGKNGPTLDIRLEDEAD